MTETPAIRPDRTGLPLLLLPLLVPIATTNLTGFGFEHAFTNDTLRLIKLVLIAVLVLAAAIAWGRRALAAEGVVRWHRALTASLALLGIAVISASTSLNPSSAIFGSYQYRQGLLALGLFVAAAFLSCQVGDRRFERMLAGAVVLGGLPVAAYGLMQVAGADPASWGAPGWALARGFSTLGNPDTYGGYLIFPATLAFGLALAEERAVRRGAWWAAFGLLSLALLLTQVRGAWLGLLVAAALGVTFIVRSRARFQRTDLIALGLVVALLLAGGFMAREGIARRVGEVFAGGDGSDSGRVSIWLSGVRVASAHPLLGVGADSYRYGDYEQRSIDHEQRGGYRTIADDAHSLPVMLGATLGLPALLVGVALFVLVFGSSAPGVYARGPDVASPVRAAWLAASGGYLAYALFGPTGLAQNVVLALGAGVLLAPNAVTAPAASRGVRVAALWAIVAVTAASAVTGGLALAADASYARSLGSEGQESLLRAEEAVRLAPWVYEYRARHAGLLGEEAIGATDAEAKDAALEALQAYDDLIAFAPAEYLTYVSYTRLLLNLKVLGDKSPELALKVTQRALQVYPSGLEARTLGALAHLRLGQYEDAAALLEADWNTDPGYADPYAMYAFALLGSDRFDEAGAVVDALAQEFPDDERLDSLRQALAADAADR